MASGSAQIGANADALRRGLGHHQVRRRNHGYTELVGSRCDSAAYDTGSCAVPDGVNTGARAKPDGYTLFITSGNTTMASNPHLFKKLPFDPIKDFTPVTTSYLSAFVLAVNNKTPVSSVSGLTAYLKEEKDKVN